MKNLKDKREENKIEIKAINACVAFLRSRGWNPLVGGFQAVEQGTTKYNFRLILGFTGKPPKQNSYEKLKRRGKKE